MHFASIISVYHRSFIHFVIDYLTLLNVAGIGEFQTYLPTPNDWKWIDFVRVSKI